uniref:Uncharacterized protein n=1 Tax=Physcomitrium patens TaxID=3218 RepID=A0A2K1K064_PHYPA|nr:hypothetical protein PHYPA_014286 [Physcomitrium patens]
MTISASMEQLLHPHPVGPNTKKFNPECHLIKTHIEVNPGTTEQSNVASQHSNQKQTRKRENTTLLYFHHVKETENFFGEPEAHQDLKKKTKKTRKSGIWPPEPY